METKKQYISVIAICISIILAGAIIAYRPPQVEEEDSLFKFPSGIPPSLGSMSSVALSDEQVNAIMVSGSGSASAQANQATLTLGAWTEDPVASEAVEDNAILMNSIIEAVMALGIEEDKIKTVQYSVSPNYNWETRTVTGYRVTNMIQIEVDDIDLVGSVIDEASDAGANSIQGISFGLSDEVADSLTEEAYVLALQNAQGKAALIAETLELEITGVLSVSESVFYPYTPYRSVAEATYDSGSAPTPIIEGSLSVSVNVQVAFSFQ
jgi:uncharacterized protein YggE